MTDLVFAAIAVGSGLGILAGIAGTLLAIEWVEKNVFKVRRVNIFKLPQ